MLKHEIELLQKGLRYDQNIPYNQYLYVYVYDNCDKSRKILGRHFRIVFY